MQLRSNSVSAQNTKESGKLIRLTVLILMVTFALSILASCVTTASNNDWLTDWKEETSAWTKPGASCGG